MRQIFVHLHIPKCGGSTVREFLVKNFGSALGDTNSILNDYQYNAAQVARIIDQFPQLRCLTGHKLSLDLPFDRPDLSIQAITWIRDPVDRFVSHYFYHRNHTTLVPETKTMDLREYADWALRLGNQKMYINGQLRFLSGGSLDKIVCAVKSGKLLIFPLAKLQESIFTLCHKFPEAFVHRTLKTRNESKKDQPLPENFREAVLPYVTEDMALLSLACETPSIIEPQNVGPRHTANQVSVKAFDQRGCLFEISNSVESFRIEKYGGEEEFTREILGELRSSDVFYDIGSSVGFLTVHAARTASKVVSFEPDPEVRSRLIHNLRLNDLRNVLVVEWAVADKEGEAFLFTDGAKGKSPSLRQVGRRKQIALRTDSIDHALGNGTLPVPDVIKIDIEGAELLALKGMRGLLGSSRAPRVIFLEIHPEFLPLFNANESDVTDFLASFGYERIRSVQRSSQVHARFQRRRAVTIATAQRGGVESRQTPRKGYAEVDLLARWLDFHGNSYCLVDVGAHVGSFSKHFALRRWRVIAFEPEPSNFRELVSAFKGSPNVTCVPQAISDQAGHEVPFFVSCDHWGIHSLKPFHSTHCQEIKVRTVRLEKALMEFGVQQVTLLKVDTEGADFLVLKSCDFSRLRPRVVICEFMDARSKPHFGYSHHEMVRYMAQFGYVAFVSEWAPIEAYGRKGVASSPHRFLRCIPYPLDHEPAWGNLIFIQNSEVREFQHALHIYLRELGIASPEKQTSALIDPRTDVANKVPVASRKSKKNPFSRSVSNRDIDLLKQVSVVLGKPASDEMLQKFQDRILQIESRCQGRLAGDIQDALLRVLIARSVRSPALSMLEIGVLFGVNAAILYETSRDQFHRLSMLLIDPLDGYYGAGRLDVTTNLPVTREYVEHNLNASGVPKEAYRICQAFSASQTAIKTAEAYRYNYIFIDGDHSYEGVRSDFQLYGPFLQGGGYLVFDNYKDGTSPGVDRFIDEVMINASDYREIVRAWRTIVFQRN